METIIKNRQGSILEKLTQRQSRREQARFDMSRDDCDNEISDSTQLIQIQKSQVIDHQESLERFCNVLPVSGVNSAKYELNLTKPIFYPFLLTNGTLNALS